MFIVEPNVNREMKIMLRAIKTKMGAIPPHFEVLATIAPTRFKMFIEEINYLSRHKNIEPDFFTFLRFYVATKNNFKYCEKLNKEFLLAKGYGIEVLESFIETPKMLPLDERHQFLFEKVLLSLDSPSDFSAETLKALKEDGWSDEDIYDAIDHGAFLFKFSKILKTYSV